MKNYLKESRLSMLSIEKCIDNVSKGKLTPEAAKNVINHTIHKIVVEDRQERIQNKDKSKIILSFFIWFRENGEKYKFLSADNMISIYLKSRL